MGLLFCGISYRRAPVAVRERFALGEAERTALLQSLHALPGVRGAAALATCNRTEVYLSADRTECLREPLLQILAERSGLSPEECRPLLVWRRGLAAARHLLEVASGLDSMIVGENQILAQVKATLATAREAGTMEGPLERLLVKAAQTGKRVRTETEISRGVSSVSHAAVDLARQHLGGRLDSIAVLVMGAGKMGSLALRHLTSAGVSEIRVSNRTLEKACDVARHHGARAVPLEDLGQHLREVDLILSATGAPHPVVLREHVEAAMEQRGGRPLILVDLALPRDIDPGCALVPGVRVLDLDDLKRAVQQSQKLRSSHARRAREIVEEELAAWTVSEADRRASEAIRTLRAPLEERLRPETLEAHRALQKLLHAPTVELRRLARQGLSSTRLMREARRLGRQLATP